MRFMVIVKADKDSEAGVMPSEKLLAEMGEYNDKLVEAGVMLAGEGLQASAKGARVRFSGAKRTVINGPFPETNDLIAGFWLFQVKSKEEAIEWVKRCPNPLEGESEIEIRQVFEAEDFGAEFTPALREQEEYLRAQVAARDWVRLFFNLPPAKVAAALDGSGLFLRPTSWDGDALILRQALSRGTRVLASDAAPRPAGVELAELDPQAFARAVLDGGVHSDGRRLGSDTTVDAALRAVAALKKQLRRDV